MPQIVKLTQTDPAAPGGPNPGGSPSPQPITPGSGQAPIIAQTTVSLDQAIAAAEGSKIATITGLSGPSALPGGSGASVSMAGLVDAKLAVDLMDAAVPAALVWLCFKIGMKLKKSDLQLTEKEKNTLAPIVQKCLEQLMINFQNPWVALSVSLLTIYGSKIAEKGAFQFFENKQKKIEDAAKQQETDRTKLATIPGGLQPVGASTSSGTNPVSSVSDGVASKVYEPTEYEIEDKMRKGKHGRKKAVQLLKAIHAAKQKQVA